MISDYLSNKKDKEVVKLSDDYNEPNEKHNQMNEDVLEKITEQLSTLETTPGESSTPPPSPAVYDGEIKYSNETNTLNGEVINKTAEGMYLYVHISNYKC